jgi:hypothetical protein
VFDVRGFVALHTGNDSKAATTTSTTATDNAENSNSAATIRTDSNSDSSTNSSYYPLVDGKVSSYICSIPAVSAIIGTTAATDVQSSEIGDGNLNLVFICK